MSKKKKSKPIKAKGKTVRADVLSIVAKVKSPISVRVLLDKVNKSRKPKDRVTIFAVRRIVNILREDKTLSVTKVDGKAAVMGKKGKVKK